MPRPNYIPKERKASARFEVRHSRWAARGPLVAVLDQKTGTVTFWEKGRRRRYVGDLEHMFWAYYEKLAQVEADRDRLARKAARGR